MKCPKCNAEGFRYINLKKKLEVENKDGTKKTIFQRENNIAKCIKCGFEGV